jgi:hypothetical protein
MKIKCPRGHRDGADRPSLHTLADSGVVVIAVVAIVLEQHVVQLPVLVLLLLLLVLLEMKLLLVLLEVCLAGIERKVVQRKFQAGLIQAECVVKVEGHFVPCALSVVAFVGMLVTSSSNELTESSVSCSVTVSLIALP